MKKYYINIQICTLLLLILFIPCYGQVSEYMFRCSLRDKAGNLWFGTTGAGVYRYDAASDKSTHFTKEDGLNDNNIESVFEDKAGNLWFGTDNGVCRYDARLNDSVGQGKSFTDITTKEGLCKFDINCIAEDRIGNIWIGSNGWGVCRYNPVSGAVTNFTKEQGLGSNGVQCILEDKSGNLWFGERGGGVCRYDSTSGRFTKVDGDGCFSSQIMSIIEDKTGNIWFVNLYSGLCRYDPSASLRTGSKSYTHFTKENGLCSDTIDCIYEDKKGNLWFGSDTKWNTGAGGVCRYDARLNDSVGQGKSFTRFSTTDGLANSDVWTIVEDNDGNIWVGTRGGLFRYHSPSGKFINYTYKVKKQ
jgi:ligand-binding sensor domain-containing protein